MVEYYWTAKALAEAAGMSPEEVQQEIDAGRIEAERAGDRWVVADEEARRWLTRQMSKIK